MASIASRLLARTQRPEGESRAATLMSLADVLQQQLAGLWGRRPMEQTLLDGRKAAYPDADIAGHAWRIAYNPVIYALHSFRASSVASGTFAFRRIRQGRPSDFFGNATLAVLERPWPAGTTQDLLKTVMADVDTAGNCYLRRDVVNGSSVIVRMPPDEMKVVTRVLPSGGRVPLGFIWDPYEDPARAVPFLADEVAHVMPYPDPAAPWRGMSWLTPVAREVLGDDTATLHMQKYLENAATPNVMVAYPSEMDPTEFAAYVAAFDAANTGPMKAGRTAHVGGGADVTVVGANLKDAQASLVRTAGETRMAAAAGVPPVLVGFADASGQLAFQGYDSARRRFVDTTLHDLWQNIASSLAVLVPPPDSGSRLVVDYRDIPLLRDDSKAEAEIRQMNAATMFSLRTTGFTVDSIQAFIQSGDYSLLADSGLTSVQLLPPGASANEQPNANGDPNA